MTLITKTMTSSFKELLTINEHLGLPGVGGDHIDMWQAQVTSFEEAVAGLRRKLSSMQSIISSMESA